MNRTLSLSQDGDINSRENTAASAADGLRVGRRNRLGLGLHVRRELTRRSLRSHRADLPLLLSRPDPSSHRPSCSSTARAIAPRTWSTPGSISPKKEKAVLLAPELPRDPKFENAAAGIFRCVVEDARQILGVDPQRVYLFGNSSGRVSCVRRCHVRVAILRGRGGPCQPHCRRIYRHPRPGPAQDADRRSISAITTSFSPLPAC